MGATEYPLPGGGQDRHLVRATATPGPSPSRALPGRRLGRAPGLPADEPAGRLPPRRPGSSARVSSACTPARGTASRTSPFRRPGDSEPSGSAPSPDSSRHPRATVSSSSGSGRARLRWTTAGPTCGSPSTRGRESSPLLKRRARWWRCAPSPRSSRSTPRGPRRPACRDSPADPVRLSTFSRHAGRRFRLFLQRAERNGGMRRPKQPTRRRLQRGRCASHLH